MVNSIDQNQSLSGPENEVSHGIATIFLGNVPQNSNFVWFGGRLDRFFGHYQLLPCYNDVLKYSIIKFMSIAFQSLGLKQTINNLNHNHLNDWEGSFFDLSITVFMRLQKKIQNEEV
jgi:hypothetical protein